RSAVALLDQRGCLDCHSLDGSADVGPTFQKIFGRTQTVLRGSEEVPVIVDEAYLRRAIRDPLAETARGSRPTCHPTS
ncbi:MAG: cytochrome c oxidase subunit II, partial [Candidatus Eisenbacteria bacterium]